MIEYVMWQDLIKPVNGPIVMVQSHHGVCIQIWTRPARTTRPVFHSRKGCGVGYAPKRYAAVDVNRRSVPASTTTVDFGMTPQSRSINSAKIPHNVTCSLVERIDY